jgi:formylglycine-generating enzyme required for sulfatase activity
LKRLLATVLFLLAVFSYGQVSDRFVLLDGGAFTMGSPANEPRRAGNETAHQVTVSSFYIGKYEVTQAEYQELMGANPSLFKGENLPVEQVNWFNAVAYCNRLSERDELKPAYAIAGQNVTWDKTANGYRLPTEAEWEYACRAGTSTPFSTGNNITSDQANFNGTLPYNNNSRTAYRQRTAPVGSFAPNSFGAYDMHGNVAEWCWDWHGEYARGEQTNPAGAASGGYRIFRGGGWNHSADFLRSARRSALAPSERGYFLGFRLVRNVE